MYLKIMSFSFLLFTSFYSKNLSIKRVPHLKFIFQKNYLTEMNHNFIGVSRVRAGKSKTNWLVKILIGCGDTALKKL
jgi:hypothetical protein